MKRILIIGDGTPPREYYDLAYGEGCKIVTNEISSSKYPKILRHAIYLLQAMVALVQQYRYDRIFIWAQYIGFYFSFFADLFPKAKCKVFVAYVIFKPFKDTKAAKWKKIFFLKRINSRSVDVWLFFSKLDPLYNETPPGKRVFVSYSQSRSQVIEKNKIQPKTKFYLFSGGASNRNNDLLGDAWRDTTLPPLKAVVENKTQIPSNEDRIEWYVHIPSQEFDRLLAQSSGVILPLSNPNVLSGQIVLLKAIEAGLPVYVTASAHIDEWIGSPEDTPTVHRFKTAKELQVLLRDSKGWFEHAQDELKYSSLYEMLGDTLRFSKALLSITL